MDKVIGFALLAFGAYLALVVGHKAISVVLILADDCLHVLMKIFRVRRSKRRGAAAARGTPKTRS